MDIEETRKKLNRLINNLIMAQDNVTHLNEKGPEFAQVTQKAIVLRDAAKDDIIFFFEETVENYEIER